MQQRSISCNFAAIVQSSILILLISSIKWINAASVSAKSSSDNINNNNNNNNEWHIKFKNATEVNIEDNHNLRQYLYYDISQNIDVDNTQQIISTTILNDDCNTILDEQYQIKVFDKVVTNKNMDEATIILDYSMIKVKDSKVWNVLSNDILTISFCIRTELQYKDTSNNNSNNNMDADVATKSFVETNMFVSFDLSMDIFSTHPATITKGHSFSTVYVDANKHVNMCVCDNKYNCLSKDNSKLSKGSDLLICVMGSSPSLFFHDIELNNMIFYQDDIAKFTPIKEGLRTPLSTLYKVQSPSINERNFPKKKRYISVLETQLPSSFYDNYDNPAPLTILGEAVLSSKDVHGQKKYQTTKLVMIASLEKHTFLETFVLNHHLLIAFISICCIFSAWLLNISYKIVVKERMCNSVPIYSKNNNSWHKNSPRQQQMFEMKNQTSMRRRSLTSWDDDQRQQQMFDMKRQSSLRRRSCY